MMIDPAPLAPGSAALVATGIILYTLIALAGILLVHAPWARWLGAGATAGALLMVGVTGFDSGWALVSIGLGLAALAGLAGPWLNVWLRQRPGTGPQPVAVALPLVAIGAAPVAGLAAWSELTTGALIAAVAGVVAAAAYARASRIGLWVLRIGYPLLALIAAVPLGVPEGLLLAGHGAAVAGLAWPPTAARAQRPIGAELPAPRYRKRPS